MVKNTPSNAGDVGSIPGQGTKDPTCHRKLSPWATTRQAWEPSPRSPCTLELTLCTQEEPACHNKDLGQPPKSKYGSLRLSTYFLPWQTQERKKVALSCLTLCHPMNCTPPGSSVHGILQARILEWVAIPFSRGSSWPRDWTLVSSITGRFFTVWHQGSPDRLTVVTNIRLYSPGGHHTTLSWK